MIILKNLPYFFLLALAVVSSTHEPVALAQSQCRKDLSIIDQFDPRFREAGLFSAEGESKICGPVCIVQALVEQGVLPEEKRVQEVISMVNNDFEPWGIGNVIENGMYEPELVDALRNSSQRYGHDLSIREMNYAIKEDDLLLANDDETTVIVRHRGWGKLRDITKATPYNATGGQYTILSGVTKKEGQEGYQLAFNDPAFGKITPHVAEEFMTSFPDDLSLRLDFKDSGLKELGWLEPGYIRMIVGLIVIKQKKGK